MRIPRERAPATHDAARDAAASRTASAPASPVLALQRGAGNHAVSALIARDGAKAPPKDKAAGGKAPAVSGPRVVLDPLGVIPVESFQLPMRQLGRGGAVGSDAPQATQTLTFTSKQGPHSAALLAAAHVGEPMDGDVITPGGTLHVTGALVDGYTLFDRTDPPLESWSLIAATVTFTPAGGDKKQ